MQDMNFRVTQKQVGNGIGTILASIGIPLAIDAIKGLTGRGVRGGAAVRIGNRGGGSPRIGRPPPFIGSLEGGGKKPRFTAREKQPIQQNSNKRFISVKRPTLKFHRDIPMSNFDLLEWCRYLKIPIKNVLSRDGKVPHNHKLALLKIIWFTLGEYLCQRQHY